MTDEELEVRGTLAEGDGRVLACEPRRRIRFESGEPGEPLTLDEVDLRADGDGAVQVALVRSRPTTDLLAVYAVGTQLHLEHLAAYLEGRAPVDPERFWAALRPRWEALAG